MPRGLRDSQYWTEIGNWFQWILTSLQRAELSHLLDDIQRGSGRAVLVILLSGSNAGSSENTSFDVQQSFHLRALCFHIEDPGSQGHSHRACVRRQSLPSPTCASASLPTRFKGRNLWKDQTLQFGKTGKDFLIKQKRAALLACEWCCTGLERKLDALYQLARLVCLQFVL